MKHYIHGWDMWLTDEELAEMQQVSRRIEGKSKGVAELVAKMEEARKRNPKGLVF